MRYRGKVAPLPTRGNYSTRPEISRFECFVRFRWSFAILLSGSSFFLSIGEDEELSLSCDSFIFSIFLLRLSFRSVLLPPAV